MTMLPRKRPLNALDQDGPSRSSASVPDANQGGSVGARPHLAVVATKVTKAGVTKNIRGEHFPGPGVNRRVVNPLEPCPGGHRVRIKYGPKATDRARFFIPSAVPDPKARSEVLRELADKLRKANPSRSKLLLDRAACAPTEKDLRGVIQIAQEEPDEDTAKAQPLTFGELAGRWTSGKLAREYPDYVKTKRSADQDASRLVVLNKAIGDVRLDAFTLRDAERAMATIPDGRASATRRQYAQLIVRVMKLAVFPCRLIASNPLPEGFLPKVKSQKVTAWLYPDEELILMKSEVPIARRLLYGFLAREGCRLSEALSLRWSDLDLERGAVRLDKNKTDDPRAWALRPDVGHALKASKDEDAEPNELVFGTIDERAAEQFRADLQAAGVNRAELFDKKSKVRRPIRVHDLRATFVTLALANGKTEAWVCDRTGHRSSVMVNRYRRQARQATELGLGELAPLDVALGLVTKPTGGDSGNGDPSTGESDDQSRPPIQNPKGPPPIAARPVAKPVANNSAPGRTRTCDQWIRNPPLCPAELRAQELEVSCRVVERVAAACGRGERRRVAGEGGGPSAMSSGANRQVRTRMSVDFA
jgi:integrase